MLLLVAHQNDEGEVDADGEVGDGQHVGRSNLDILVEFDEAHHGAAGPAGIYHNVVDEEAEAQHQATANRRQRGAAAPYTSRGTAVVRASRGGGR